MDDNKRSVDIDNNKDEERMENDFLDDEMMGLPMICRIYPCHEGDVLPGAQVTRRGGFGDYTKGAMSGSKVD